MMRGKRHLYHCKHPFNEYPFEAFFCDYWQPVDFIRIKDGIIAMHLDDNRWLIEEKRPFSNLRVKSRRAILSDCTCFLRPGIDICVLSASGNKDNSDEDNNEDPVWVDARIISVERKPHENECSCQFYVKFYVNRGPLGSDKGTLSKESKLVGIDQISILQRLEKEACEDRHYRWNYSEDCTLLQKTKLFLGKFSSDLSWLLVASVLKQTAFDVRSLQNKIVYQILGDDDDTSCSSNSDNHLNAINFKVEDDILTSYVVPIVPDDTVEALPACEVQEPEPLTFYEVMDLRRSKRRNVQPERFLGSDISPDSNTGWVRMLPYRIDRGEEDDDDEEDMHLPLSYLFGAHAKCSEENPDGDMRILHSKSKYASRESISGVASLNEDINELAIVPVPTESDPIACYDHDQPAKNSRNCSRGNDESSSKYYITSSSSVQRRSTYKVERTELRSKWKGKAPKYYPKSPSYSEPQSTTSELEFMEFDSSWGGGRTSTKKDKSKNFFNMEDMGFPSSSWGKPTNKRVQSNRYRPISSKQGESCEKVTYKKASLSAGAYNRLINNYMKNIDHTVSNEEPSIIDQWNQFKASKTSETKIEMEESSSEEEEEMTEMEMLWKEMELSLASAYILENNESSNADASAKSTETPTEGCRHEFTTDEEIGIICRLCNFVSTEIKYVTAPFVQQKGYTVDNKTGNEEYSTHKPDEDEGLNIFCNQDSANTPLSEENDNVWALIPEHKTKLRFHQKKAFEFLWKNVAGSLEPALMEKSSKKTGGCVISHTPGAGKTFLIIAFLVSYLRLFPGKRPLVLAPKTTLYTWYKEFIKWKISLPVHLIHGRRTYKVGKEQRLKFSQGGPRPSHDVMHVLDCLEKIQKWHSQPSVLVMGYTSFLTLMREDSRFAHRKFMAKVLRESPGILVLDEGHNPRSTKSRLRKVLMKVESDVRILLSGTLFQNNFCEYFNTLCLARPKFINEVLKVLDPKFKGKKKGKKKARHLLEARARKFFIDNIARKIDLEGDERMEGLNMLRNITNGFIDVYEGGSADGLPGLQIYTLMMNATDVQHKVLVKLRDIMETYKGYPLELELLITLASIHPWLVKTSNCAHKFFSPEELIELERYKYEFRKGSKVMFVLNLVHRVVKNEKVLIFCHNIAPIQLFSELFQNVFRWQKGKEILILTGDLELFDRGRIMDKFEEPGGPSRVLLASITACAEGISLTAASRVIMLDSEWNPSKTKQAIARAFRPGQQKMVYVYQLLASKTLEEDKYKRTTWKEWVSCMIFSEAFVEDPSRWQAEKIEDEVLREIVEEDRVKSFHAIMKNEKASTN